MPDVGVRLPHVSTKPLPATEQFLAANVAQHPRLLLSAEHQTNVAQHPRLLLSAAHQTVLVAPFSTHNTFYSPLPGRPLAGSLT